MCGGLALNLLYREQLLTHLAMLLSVSKLYLAKCFTFFDDSQLTTTIPPNESRNTLHRLQEHFALESRRFAFLFKYTRVHHSAFRQPSVLAAHIYTDTARIPISALFFLLRRPASAEKTHVTADTRPESFTVDYGRLR